MPALTAEQRLIVEADLEGPFLVSAGAGSGKTFTLVERAIDLVQRRGIEPTQLLLVTFTNAAAAEIAGRIDKRFGAARSGRPTCETFHGLAAGLLREFAYETGASPDLRVIDEGRARAIFGRAFADLWAGRLKCDLSAFPLLRRGELLERNLADIALRLQHLDVDADRVERRMLDRASELEQITFGGIKKFGARGTVLKDWPRPDPERTPAQRREEADAERRNARVVGQLLRRFDELLEAENFVTFGQLLINATKMLEAHREIKETVRARWTHAIVDEFQDTNATQIGLLKALFGDAMRPVLAVGDLRQAIYEFNGAEPHGIVKFSEHPGCKRFPLNVNHRSLDPILRLGHAALENRGGVPPELHDRLVAQRGDALLSEAVRVQVFEGGEQGLWAEADAVADAIAALVAGGALPQECAVLLRSRKHARTFAHALRARGLSVALQGGAGFFDAPEIREVSAWLRIIETPDDAFANTVALQSAAVGLSDGAVAALAAPGDLPRAALLDLPPDDFSLQERERLDRFRDIARVVVSLSELRPAEAVRVVVGASGADIARSSDPLAYEQARANLDKLMCVAAEFESGRSSARIGDFVEELRLRDELELDLPVAELSGDRVTISTIHKAKGLEWRYVFVANCSPGAFPLNNAGGDAVARYVEEDELLVLKHATDGKANLRWYLSSIAHDASGIFSADAKRRSDDEEYRLFYVALTRARDAVYVSGRHKGMQLSPLIRIVRDWLQRSGVDPATHAFSLPSQPQPSVPLTEEPLAAATAELRLESRLLRAAEVQEERPVRRGVLSYSAMELQERCPRRARYHYVLGLPDLSDEGSAPAPTTPLDGHEPRDVVRYGRIVHKILEQAALARIAGAPIQLESFGSDAGEEEGGTEAEVADAVRATKAAMSTLERFVPFDAERRFRLERNGVTLGGYIDLLARDETGALMVIDYKTGRTAAEHYGLQFALYAAAVEADFGEVPQCAIVRITDEHARLEPVQPASTEALLAAIERARSMESDRPKPGPDCRLCPYAHDVCSAAPVGY